MTGHRDFIDLFFGNGLYASGPSSSLMEQVTTPNDKPAEDQIDDIKKMAQKISMSIQNEMANLLAYALAGCEKNSKNETERVKRTVETPMDSTKLIMRLLNHIKSTNENQNIAIEKMMSAQEIADKYGIPFKPDPEIMNNLAEAAKENAKEIDSMYADVKAAATQDIKEEVEFVPLEQTETETDAQYPTIIIEEDPDYYHYHVPEIKERQHGKKKVDHNRHGNGHHHHHVQYIEVPPQTLSPAPACHYAMNPFYETQIQSPAPQYQYPPVSQKPAFFEPIPEPMPVCQIPMIESYDVEPELVAEELEEVVSSKIIIEKGDTPGTGTVDHRMTYTVSDKAHFKMPEQAQYAFYLSF